jgi:hypothetical protein
MSTGLVTLRLPRGSHGPWLGGVRLRWRVRKQAGELDRRLAAGVDPMLSDELSLRVGQLGSAKARTRVARALRGAVALAGRQPALLARQSGACEVQASGALLLDLAESVGGDRPLGVEGLARASLIVSSPSSPLYRDDPDPSLVAAVSEALDALERGHRTAGLDA